MRNFKPLSLLALALVALLLAACGGQTPKAVVPKGFTSLQLSLAKSSFSTQSLETLGSPYNPSNGNIAVDHVKIVVTDKNSNPVKFNYDSTTDTYTEDSGGGTTYITLNQSNQETTVNLAAAGNPYTFTSYGKDSSDNVIAYQQLLSYNIVTNPTVMVQLQSLLSKAVLTPRLPTNVVLPGSYVDLMLVVMPPSNDTFPSSYLQVPISDFTASYNQPTNANIAAYSDRGIRLQIHSDCTTGVTVTGSVAGLLDDSGTSGSIDINGSSGFSLPCASTAGNVVTDLVPPTVSITSYNTTTHIVTGTADDNYGIAKVQIYDGPRLLASSDTNEQNPGVVAAVTFSGTNFTAHLSSLSNPPAGGISAVAIDTSGNQATTKDTLNPNVIYVSATGDNDSTGDGSQAAPYATIAKGVSEVAQGGTVYVESGTYTPGSAITVPEDVTILGQSGATISVDPTSLAKVFSMTNDGATIEGLTITYTAKAPASSAVMVYIQADNITIRGNTFSGQFVSGDSGVGRAMVISYGSTGLNITDNTVAHLRQPAYINGSSASPTTGAINNNRVYGTKGWVIDGALMTFTHNIWTATGAYGVGTSGNIGCDIALLASVPKPTPVYDPISTLAANNGGALLNMYNPVGVGGCDQR